MKKNGKEAVSIIGGADGPTSVFICGKDKNAKVPLKNKIGHKVYELKAKRAEKKIVPKAHTIDEVIAYAKEKYGVVAVEQTRFEYQGSQKSMKEGIIFKYMPELLGDLQEIRFPDNYDESSVREFYRQLEERNKKIEKMTDEEVPMDFHMYELRTENRHLKIELDYRWNIFGISYSGDKKKGKYFKRIVQDLYMYYGVTEEDMKNKTERYLVLKSVLSM